MKEEPALRANPPRQSHAIAEQATFWGRSRLRWPRARLNHAPKARRRNGRARRCGPISGRTAGRRRADRELVSRRHQIPRRGCGPRASRPLFGGTVGQGHSEGRVWRKGEERLGTPGTPRSLAEEADRTADSRRQPSFRVRLDRKARPPSRLLVVLGRARAGRPERCCFAIKSMGRRERRGLAHWSSTTSIQARAAAGPSSSLSTARRGSTKGHRRRLGGGRGPVPTPARFHKALETCFAPCPPSACMTRSPRITTT